jgi:hypothetical protein
MTVTCSCVGFLILEWKASIMRNVLIVDAGVKAWVPGKRRYGAVCVSLFLLHRVLKAVSTIIRRDANNEGRLYSKDRGIEV